MTATSPARLTRETSRLINSSPRSPMPTTSHSTSSATPGRMAISGSASNSEIVRCTENTAARAFKPTSTAVTFLGVRL